MRYICKILLVSNQTSPFCAEAAVGRPLYLVNLACCILITLPPASFVLLAKMHIEDNSETLSIKRLHANNDEKHKTKTQVSSLKLSYSLYKTIG